MALRVIALFLIFSVIQECSTSCTVNNGGCDGICTEVGFQTKCSCNILGTLQPDGKTCKYKGMIYYAHGHRIDFVFNSTFRRYVKNFPLNQIKTIASDIQSSKIFYAAVGFGMSIVGEFSLHTLKRKNLTIENGTVDGMAYNRTSKDLYYALVGGPVKVIRNVDRLIPNAELLLQMNKPRAIALDSCFGYIFISDWGSHEIIRYNPMDRSKVSVITSGLAWPNALAIDTLTQKIFWADAN
ncbi:low-density lipoprotein receptor-related protein 2-like isoform X2 [Hydractinia symbiolongicarpus]|uniref:low-density lipoprotein receptor-related protein 2-like isoform X2 n=1 Tax=Hydractinia symbiolongicarpus TaxID=13093 RepID=UPI00254A12AA|nr:low-density lipoprotein receptor-related protein 2-like isoform X2 [Hydractinia symbiolongicarpus]